MDKASIGAKKKAGREFQLLLTASLISRFETISEEEVYEKASRCFDSLLDARESSEVARRISLLIDKSASSVQHSAGAIIDLLLFNKKYDPYMSLGLPRFAYKSEVSRRWRRLIVLYHPDKYPNQREYYEEKAKKINEAYDEIRKETDVQTSPETFMYPFRAGPSHTEAALYRRYLKHVPTFILALVIFIALVSVVFFISIMTNVGHY